MSEKKSNVKKRNWTFVLYPDSAPSDWQDILQKTGLQCAISPLHDSDVNAAETQKKSHWHVLLCYGGPTSYNIVQALTAGINGTIPQPVEQVKGLYRYFMHLDNTEKVQYNEADIITINGFSIRDYVDMTRSEVVKYKSDIMRFVEENDIREYCDLLVELDKANLSDMWEVAANHTIFADAYVRSRRHKYKELEQRE
jgi:hypothetical protein